MDLQNEAARVSLTQIENTLPFPPCRLPIASAKRAPRLGVCPGGGAWLSGSAERLQRRRAQAVAHRHPGDPGGAEGPREPHQRHRHQQQPPVHRVRVSHEATRGRTRSHAGSRAKQHTHTHQRTHTDTGTRTP